MAVRNKTNEIVNFFCYFKVSVENSKSHSHFNPKFYLS